MMQPSTLDRMRNTIFRSKSDATAESPSKGRRLSNILSPTRSNKDTPKSGLVTPSATEPPQSPVPPNPYTSPSSSAGNRQELSLDGPSDQPPEPIKAEHELAGAHADTLNQPADPRSDTDQEAPLKRRRYDGDSSFLPDPSSFVDAGEASQTGGGYSYRHRASPRLSDTNSRLSPYNPYSQRPYTNEGLSRDRDSFRDTDLLSGARRSVAQRPPRASPMASDNFKYNFPDEDQVDYSDGSLSDSRPRYALSSPAAAAAKRNQLRVSSARTASYRGSLLSGTYRSPTTGADDRQRAREDSHEQRPRQSKTTQQQDLSLSERSSAKRPAPKAAQRNSSNQERMTATSQNLMPAERQSREASQRSSVSSSRSTGDSVQGSGNATPASLSTLRAGDELSRLPSVRSVASTMSVRSTHSSDQPLQASQSSQNEESQSVEEDDSQTPKAKHSPATPLARQSPNLLPTDTVLAQHVQNVQVPETLARNHKAAQVPRSAKPSSPLSTLNFGRSKDNLTLKEQNSRIDRLSKENFDLKLKIYFLDKTLQERSDEGVADLQAKNANLSSDLVKLRKDNQSLRRRLRELERSNAQHADRLSAVRTINEESEDGISAYTNRQGAVAEEMTYLRDRMQQLEVDNGQLSRESAAKEFERRRMAESLQRLTGQGQTGHASQASDVWKDALDEETARRKRAELEVEELYQEIARLKSDRSPGRTYLNADDRSYTNGFRPNSGRSTVSREGASLSGTTLVGHLKQENADLRRDLGAQTSMLTSRNRERERLQQEIEDLKITHRRGDFAGSSAGDSVLDRSVSRANNRSVTGQKPSPMGDLEREEYEALHGSLRDDNAALRMRCQDIQRELNELANDTEHVDILRNDRDEALQLLSEERDFAAETIDRLELDVERKEQDIHNLLADLRTREDESGVLQREIQEISEGLDRVVEDCENSQSTIQELRDSLSNADGEIENLEQALRDGNAANERLEVEAESQQNEITFLREEQEGDKIKIGDLEAALKSARASAREEQDRLREFEELDAEVRKAHEETRRMQKALHAQADEAENAQKGFVEFEQGIRQAFGMSDEQRDELVSQAAQLQSDLERAIQELDNARDEVNNRDEAIDAHQHKLQSSGTDIQKLTTLLNKEREARKNDHAQYERGETSPGGSARIAELEQARTDDQQRLHALDELYTAQVQERNARLFEFWLRVAELCGDEWVEKYIGSEEAAPSLESITNDATILDEPLNLALQTLENTLSTFRTRIRSTEKDIYKDFQALELTLEARSKRLSQLESALANGQIDAPPTSAPLSSDDLSRLRHENKLLKRELRILRQGAFALPGLPPPAEDLDRAVTAAAAITREREGRRHPNVPGIQSLVEAATGAPSLPAEQDQDLDGQRSRHSRRSRRTKSATDNSRNAADEHEHDREQHHPAAASTENSPSDSTSASAPQPPQHRSHRHKPAPQTQNQERSLSKTHPHHSTITTTSTAPTSHTIDPHPVPSSAHPTLAPSEQRWILRLQELKKRLNAEREARLLDRDGARRRLEEQGEEVRALRGVVERGKRERGTESGRETGETGATVNGGGEG
ncbi:MAG: Anucleate primary sterigmata protein B [Chrysothrix sp. TS-e1954]|nr:MAG: Anucleate primary sterigmata protein B [Chrysothrix sp. TS-e1954]